jgi:hypothetical protein
MPQTGVSQLVNLQAEKAGGLGLAVRQAFIEPQPGGLNLPQHFAHDGLDKRPQVLSVE